MSIEKIGHAYIADTARVVGEVTLGKNVNVWYSAVVRGDVGPITIGDNTNVQDHVMIHCDSGTPNVIGSHVTMGHGAIVHGASVGDGTLIGMHATVLGGTRIGRRCLIAAGALVPPNTEVPHDSVVMGVPGRIIRETTEEEKQYLTWLSQQYVKLAQRHHDKPFDPRVKPYAG